DGIGELIVFVDIHKLIFGFLDVFTVIAVQISRHGFARDLAGGTERTVSVASSHAIPPSPSDFVKELIVLIDITERNPRIVLRFCSVPIEVSHSGLTRDLVPWPEGAIGITRRDSLITQPGNLPIELFVGSDVTQIVSLCVHEVADVTVPGN